MEHSLHIAAKHFVEAVAPASTAAIRKKVKKARKSGDLFLHNLDTVLSKTNGNDGHNEDEDEDEDTEFVSGDSLGKAIALVRRYIFHSTIIFLPHTFLRSGNHPRQEYFSKHHAIKWTLSRWNCYSGLEHVGHHYTSFLKG